MDLINPNVQKALLLSEGLALSESAAVLTHRHIAEALLALPAQNTELNTLLQYSYSVSTDVRIPFTLRKASRQFIQSLLQKVDTVSTVSLFTVLLENPEVREWLTKKDIHWQSLVSATQQSKQVQTTPTLNGISENVTKKAVKGDYDPFIGRRTELEDLCKILARRQKPNVLLTGIAGGGKTALIQGLALHIAKGNVPSALQGKQVLELNLAKLAAQCKYPGDLEERTDILLTEAATAGNLILYIDEAHTLQNFGSMSSVDLIQLLKLYINRPGLSFILSTTNREVRVLERDEALMRRFVSYALKKNTDAETLDILRGIKHLYEKHYSLTIPDEILSSAIRFSNRYMFNRAQPAKAIDILDHAGSLAANRTFHIQESIRESVQLSHSNANKAVALLDNDVAAAVGKMWSVPKQNTLLSPVPQHYPNVTLEDVALAVSIASNVPVATVRADSKFSQKTMVTELEKHIVGQSHALKVIAHAISRAKAGFTRNKPLGTFLLLGPTGVGKTETAKAIADYMFGNKGDNMIVIDCNELQQSHSISRLWGAPPGFIGYEEGGMLTNKIKENPHTVVLLDEIEKAHPNVFKALMQIFDEGRMTDGRGQVTDFRNALVLATSNIGQAAIQSAKEGFGLCPAEESFETDVKKEMRKFFPPEFINRLDDYVIYNELTEENLEAIAVICMQTLQKQLQENALSFTWTDDVPKAIVNEAKKDHASPNGRPIRRATERLISDFLTEEIHKGTILPESSVTLAISEEGTITIQS